MVKDISARIRELLPLFYADPRALKEDVSYSGSFAEEGARKARFIVDDISSLHDEKLIDASRWVALSIGGADGSDLMSILTKTSVSQGVLLEYSDESAAAAERLNDLLPPSKHIEVLVGDAGQKFGEALNYLRPMVRDGKVDGVIFIFLAVLHELPVRSRYFNLYEVLGQAGDLVNQNILLYASEPTIPISWTERVILRVGTAETEDLLRFATALRDRWWDKSVSIEQRGQGRVLMPKALAAEVLFKLVRNHDEKRDHYELQERLTSFDLEDFTAQLHQHFPGDNTEIDTYRTVSRGFRAAYKQCNISVWTTDNRQLETPDTHAKVILRHIAPVTKTTIPQHPIDVAAAEAELVKPEADRFHFSGIRATMLVYDFNRNGYVPSNIITSVSSWDDASIPPELEERFRDASLIADNQQAMGRINDNPIFALRSISFSRIGVFEPQGLKLDFAETTYKPKRARMIMFHDLLTAEEKSRIVDESKEGLSAFFSNCFNLQLGVISSDNKLMIVRRADHIVNGGKYTCGIAETMQGSDRKKGSDSIQPDVYETALRGLHEEIGLSLKENARRVIYLHSIMLDVDYYEVLMMGFADFTRIPSSDKAKCTSSQMLENFHNGEAKDKWENKEVTFIENEVNSAVHFALSNESNFTNYGLVCFLNMLRIKHTDQNVRAAIDRYRSQEAGH